jgi:hypothetical protein
MHSQNILGAFGCKSVQLPLNYAGSSFLGSLKKFRSRIKAKNKQQEERIKIPEMLKSCLSARMLSTIGSSKEGASVFCLCRYIWIYSTALWNL